MVCPNNDTDDEKKDTVYKQLQTVLDKAEKKDVEILISEFYANTGIGADNTGYNIGT